MNPETYSFAVYRPRRRPSPVMGNHPFVGEYHADGAEEAVRMAVQDRSDQGCLSGFVGTWIAVRTPEPHTNSQAYIVNVTAAPPQPRFQFEVVSA